MTGNLPWHFLGSERVQASATHVNTRWAHREAGKKSVPYRRGAIDPVIVSIATDLVVRIRGRRTLPHAPHPEA